MKLHFYISATREDGRWARWISTVLEMEGHTTALEAYDPKPGNSFLHQISLAEEKASYFIAVLSPRYLSKPFTVNQLYSAISKEGIGTKRLLIPIRVERCVIPPLIQDGIQVDFVDRDETACRRALLDAIQPERIAELAVFPRPILAITAKANPVYGDPTAPSDSVPLRIFLCHYPEDKPLVRTLHSRLLEEGFHPWFDEEDLLPGQERRREVSRVVQDADVVIVCLSCHSISMPGHVQNEIKYALDAADAQPEGTIFIIPLRLEECDVPERLQRWQPVDYFEVNGYSRLARALRTRGESLSKRSR